MSRWLDYDDFPDWGDSGRQVEILLKDGSIVAGDLEASDVWFDGENEVPIFSVRHNGQSIPFVGHEKWRFTSPRK